MLAVVLLSLGFSIADSAVASIPRGERPTAIEPIVIPAKPIGKP